MRVAVLGTGIMGAAMAKNVAKEHDVVVWNRSREKAEATGLDAAATPQDAVAGADVVVTVLRDVDAVRETVDGLDFGDAVWMQSSTVGLGIEELAGVADRLGATMVDAPVLGTRGPAEAGELQVLVAGPAEARRRIAPVCDAVGKQTLDLGDEVGAASRLKLVVNGWLVDVMEAIAETISFAQAAGVDPQAFLDLVADGPLDMGYLQLKGKAILEGTFEPQFKLEGAAKDIRLIRELAARSGIELAEVEAAQRRFEQAVGDGHGDEDMSAVWYATRRAG
jgi:3-hydroxyisobutyrate dehydrogenase